MGIKITDNSHKEPKSTDKLYFYQQNKKGDKYLGDAWICCGGVQTDGKDKDFYAKLFTNTDNRNQFDKKYVKEDFRVIIVRGYFGNVAGRDARAIRESDIVEKYNF